MSKKTLNINEKDEKSDDRIIKSMVYWREKKIVKVMNIKIKKWKKN